MQPVNQNNLQAKVDARLRIMRTLWLVLVLSVGTYFLYTLLTGPPKDPSPNSTLSLALVAIGMLFVISSMPLKQKLLNQSIEMQSPALVQSGYILGLALCEVPALLGLLDHFTTGNRYYYVLFIVAVCGQLIHFPRRQDVLNAISKSTF